MRSVICAVGQALWFIAGLGICLSAAALVALAALTLAGLR